MVEAHFGADAVRKVRDQFPAREAADDDILDAFAALWTAERIARGDASTLPLQLLRDAEGLPMEIVVALHAQGRGSFHPGWHSS